MNFNRSSIFSVLGSTAVGTAALLLLRHWKRKVQEQNAPESAAIDDSIDVCKVGFSKKRVPKQIDVIVIGSGPSGLLCAAILSKSAGYRCVVLEQHDVAGGSTHAFECQEAGYKAEFDTGLHYIGGKMWKPETTLRRILDDLGDGKIKWHPMDSTYDHAVVGSDTYAIPAGQQALRDMLVSKFPDEEAAIDGYFAAVDEQDSCAGLFFAAGLIAGLLPRCCRWVLNSLIMPHNRISDKSLAQVLSDVGCSPRLKCAIAYHWGNMGLPPRKISFAPFAMMARHYFEGACFPVGGSKTIATALCRCIVKHGGHVFVRAPVQRILIERGSAKGVELKNGHQLQARVGVISTAGVRNTFCKLLADNEPRVVEFRRELELIPPSVQHVQLFIILKETDLPASNWWVAESADSDAIYDAGERQMDGAAKYCFFSFPSAKDPTWKERYPGTSSCIIVAGSSFEHFAAWADRRVQHRGPDYEALKERLSQKLMGVLFRVFPQLKEQVVYHEMGTPLSTQHYLGSARGESYGLAATSERYRCRELKQFSDIPGLWLSGQDTVSMGVTGAFCSGFLTALAVKPLLALKHFDWVSKL